jgi:hypothetical protein
MSPRDLVPFLSEYLTPPNPAQLCPSALPCPSPRTHRSALPSSRCGLPSRQYYFKCRSRNNGCIASETVKCDAALDRLAEQYRCVDLLLRQSARAILDNQDINLLKLTNVSSQCRARRTEASQWPLCGFRLQHRQSSEPWQPEVGDSFCRQWALHISMQIRRLTRWQWPSIHPPEDQRTQECRQT